MNKLTIVSAALLGTALITPAFAVPVTTSPGGVDDAILSFSDDDTVGQGAGINLEVDLGASSKFTNTAVLSFTGPTGLELADLVSTYGANFSTRGDIVFNVAGSLNPSDFIATQGGTPAAEDSNVSNATANISNVASLLASTASNTTSTEAATIGSGSNHAVGIVDSYDFEKDGFSNLQYAYDKFSVPTSSTPGEAPTEAVVSGALTTLNLYEYIPVSGRAGGTPTLLGTFDLTSGGSLTYTGADAAPEPSTWTLMLGGLGLFFVAMRRRWISMLS